MKIKSLILIFLSFCSLCYTSNSTQRYLEDQILGQKSLEEFVSEFCKSIERCTENKIYLSPNSLKITNMGIALEQEGKVLYLPVVHSDFSGAFIPLDNQASLLDITYCFCGWVKFEGEPCRNPDCPYK